MLRRNFIKSILFIKLGLFSNLIPRMLKASEPSAPSAPSAPSTPSSPSGPDDTVLLDDDLSEQEINEILEDSVNDIESSLSNEGLEEVSDENILNVLNNFK